MSRLDEVERLLQVVSVLQAAEGAPVPSALVKEAVTDYRTSVSAEALRRMMELDVKRLNEIGLRIDQVADPGADSVFVLRPGEWRLPVELDAFEQGLLVWLTAAADAAAAQSPAEGEPAAFDLSPLLGELPRHLDTAQTAIAQGRRLVLLKNGDEREFEPARLASRDGRWYLLGRYADWDKVIAPRLDRLEVLGLGGPVTERVEVPELDLILDSTAWDEEVKRDVELRCRTADLGPVLSWFPRAEVEDQPDGVSVLRFWTTHQEALISRVIGLAGAAWVVAPRSAADEVRRRCVSLLAGA